jgi:hypothetical protein
VKRFALDFGLMTFAIVGLLLLAYCAGLQRGRGERVVECR